MEQKVSFGVNFMDKEITYNCRLFSYPVGDHVSIYKKSITRGKNKEETNGHFNKSYKNEDRTTEQEEHAKQVSLSRTKNAIYNIARSNTWDWFITLTFDRNKTDSSDYDMIVYKLHIFLNNLQKRKCPDMKYLIVPELHEDKEHYHCHGLVSGIDNMKFCFSGHFDKSGTPIYNILDWKYGFTTATQVKDQQRVSSYVSKYITKEMGLKLTNKKRYLCSRNIERVEPEFFVVDEEDFAKVYSKNITYAKSVIVDAAHQLINYYELNDKTE